MFSILVKLTPPRAPPPAEVRVRVLLLLSLLATCRRSVSSPPSTLWVVVAALPRVMVSSPARVLMVSKPLKLVEPVLPLPLASMRTLLAEPLKFSVSVPLPPARELAPPPLMVAVSLPAPRSIEPLKVPLRVAESALESLLAPRLIDSKLLRVRPSRLVVPPAATTRVLLPEAALMLSVPLVPVRFSKPLTAPITPGAWMAAREVAVLRVRLMAVP